MNVILDIDETFVQYVGTEDWAALPEDEKIKYETGGQNKNGLFILRPHFDEFFDFLFKNAKTVNLWTWSDEEYAYGVAKLIQSHDPTWKVANVWYDEHVDASAELHGHNKDLNYIWYEKGMFQPCDTILIDDLPENTQNASNVKNGIQLLAFDPLGHKLGKALRKPAKIRTGKYTDLSKDETLLKVVELLKKAMQNPDFCKDGDLPYPFEGSTKVLGGKRRRRKTVRRSRKMNLLTRKRR
jgi:hypothetical protein